MSTYTLPSHAARQPPISLHHHIVPVVQSPARRLQPSPLGQILDSHCRLTCLAIIGSAFCDVEEGTRPGELQGSIASACGLDSKAGWARAHHDGQ